MFSEFRNHISDRTPSLKPNFTSCIVTGWPVGRKVGKIEISKWRQIEA